MQEMWADSPLLGIARALEVPLDDKAETPYSSVVIDGKLIPFVQPNADAFFASFLEPARARGPAGVAGTARRRCARRRCAAPRARLTPSSSGCRGSSFGDWVATLSLPKRVSEWIRLTIECELATDWHSFSALIGLLEFGFFLRAGPGQLPRAGRQRAPDRGAGRRHPGAEDAVGDGDRHRAVADRREARRACGSRTCATSGWRRSRRSG